MSRAPDALGRVDEAQLDAQVALRARTMRARSPGLDPHLAHVAAALGGGRAGQHLRDRRRLSVLWMSPRMPGDS